MDVNELYWMTDRVERLKARKKRCVCKYCGKPLEIKRFIFSDISDARIELYCETCGRIEFGVEPEIYQSATNFVDNLNVDFFEDLDDNAKKHQMNVAKVCEIMARGFRNTGLLTADGFTTELNMEHGAWEECMVLTSEQIPEEGDVG